MTFKYGDLQVKPNLGTIGRTDSGHMWISIQEVWVTWRGSLLDTRKQDSRTGLELDGGDGLSGIGNQYGYLHRK